MTAYIPYPNPQNMVTGKGKMSLRTCVVVVLVTLVIVSGASGWTVDDSGDRVDVVRRQAPALATNEATDVQPKNTPGPEAASSPVGAKNASKATTTTFSPPSPAKDSNSGATGTKDDSKTSDSKKADTKQTPGDTKSDAMDKNEPDKLKELKGVSSDAVLRGFYVFIGVGTIVLLYIAIKFVRLRRRPTTQKYRVLSTTSDQEMLPLAADDGEDEEIYNAADHLHSHHTLK